MRITRLQLKNFRKFKNLDLPFDAGFNVVLGPNEQGKSTLVHALIAGLFYNPLLKPSKNVLEHQSWGSEELYAISLEFDAVGEKYILTKDFQNKYLLLRDAKGKSWKTFPEVSAKMAEISGLSSPTLYESSACIYQDRVAELHSSKAELAKVLQELVTSEGQDVNVLSLVRALNREIQKMKKGFDRDVSDPGILRTVTDQLEQKRTRYTELEIRSNTIVSRQEQIGSAKKTLEELAKRKSVLENVVSKSSEAKELQKELVAINKEYERINGLLKQLEDLEKKSADLREAKGSSEDLGKMREEVEKLAELNAVLSAVQKDVAKKQAPETYVGGKGNLDIGFFVFAAAFGILGVVGFFASKLFLLSFGVAIILLVLALTERSKKRKVTVDVSGHEDEKISEVAQLQKEISERLSRLQVASLEEARAKLLDLENTERTRREVAAKIEALEGQTSKQDLISAREELAVQKIGLEKIAKDLNIEEKDFMKMVEMEQELSDVTARLQQAQEDIRAHEAVIESLGFSEGEFEELKQEIKELELEQRKVQSRIYMYEKIRDTLGEAQKRTMSSVQDILQDSIEKFLPQITGGRYEKVRVGNALEIEVFSKERGDFVNPKGNLSQGTIDQIYLVARFALARAQSEGKFPPLILDDPFVTFDAGRKSHTARLIQELTKDFQVFLFTYSDEYNSFADKVVELTNA